MVRSPKGTNNTTALPFNTSLFDVRTSIPKTPWTNEKQELKLYALPAALVEASPGLFERNAIDVRTALFQIRDSSEILTLLLDGGRSVIAGRLAGAFRNVGRVRIADEIMKAMQSAGYDIRESDPFATTIASIKISQVTSPYVNRLQTIWSTMREPIVEHFPKGPETAMSKNNFLKEVEEVYTADAYHSLSIEGYKVTPDLIDRVRSGNWNPEAHSGDNDQRNAMAARGYWQAHQAVVPSLKKILNGQNPRKVADDDHGNWYRELFAPSVTIGLLQARDLAGYRNSPVFIRKSMHVPLPADAVRDAMPTYFDLLKRESNPAVRVVLGHFMFVYIHPYMDGNGRIGRFLMNAMLAAGGYPWTVIPFESRDIYMESLEQASVNQNIVPFTKFLAELVKKRMKGKSVASVNRKKKE